MLRVVHTAYLPKGALLQCGLVEPERGRPVNSQPRSQAGHCKETVVHSRAELRRALIVQSMEIPERPPDSSVAGAAPEAGPVPALPPPLSPKLGYAPQSRLVRLLCPCLQAGRRLADAISVGPSLRPRVSRMLPMLGTPNGVKKKVKQGYMGPVTVLGV